MPDEPEVHGLLALMLLHDSRRDARLRDGELVLLAEQDEALWDYEEISQGRQALDRAVALYGGGSYTLQAAIASLQLNRPPDWAQIEALYAELARVTGSPIVELNRAVAVAEHHGAQAPHTAARSRSRARSPSAATSRRSSPNWQTGNNLPVAGRLAPRGVSRPSDTSRMQVRTRRRDTLQ